MESLILRFFPILVLLLARPPVARVTPVHELHLSHTRMVVTGTTVTARVRVFHDDTEAVLRRFANRSTLRVTDRAGEDSVFQRYYNERVHLTANGQPLQARVVASGRDPDTADPVMWWYEVEYRAPQRVVSLALRQHLMFEQFQDQRNILTVIAMPSEERYSLYFSPSDLKAQVLKF